MRWDEAKKEEFYRYHPSYPFDQAHYDDNQFVTDGERPEGTPRNIRISAISPTGIYF